MLRLGREQSLELHLDYEYKGATKRLPKRGWGFQKTPPLRAVLPRWGLEAEAVKKGRVRSKAPPAPHGVGWEMLLWKGLGCQQASQWEWFCWGCCWDSWLSALVVPVLRVRTGRETKPGASAGGGLPRGSCMKGQAASSPHHWGALCLGYDWPLSLRLSPVLGLDLEMKSNLELQIRVVKGLFAFCYWLFLMALLQVILLPWLLFFFFFSSWLRSLSCLS